MLGDSGGILAVCFAGTFAGVEVGRVCGIGTAVLLGTVAGPCEFLNSGGRFLGTVTSLASEGCTGIGCGFGGATVCCDI